MSKVKYNKFTKMYERTILINGICALVCFYERKYLEELPYRLYSGKKGNGEKE